MVKTPCFQCRGGRFNPLVEELRSHMPCGLKKKKKRILVNTIGEWGMGHKSL